MTTRIGKNKKALMNLGYTLDQVNKMSALERFALLKTQNIDSTEETDVVAPMSAVTKVDTRTDEEVEAQIKEYFDALEDLTLATVMGANKSLIVSGKAGVGKSHGVFKVAKAFADDYVSISGFTQATGLYRTLYENRKEGSVIIFDDCDDVFKNETCMNILKAVCDMSDRRTVSWMSETNMRDEFGERLPRSFQFEGQIIFITNVDFQREIDADSKMSPHFEAMMSRSLYLDVDLRSKRDAFTRIKQVVTQTPILDNISKEDQWKVLNWIWENADNLRDLSLRTAKKLATLIETTQDKWESLAKKTLCKVQ